jgi:hypothetical protein
VKDANGLVLATIHCRDDLQRWSFGHNRLTSDEARKIAKASPRIPEFMMQRRGFYSRGDRVITGGRHHGRTTSP